MRDSGQRLSRVSFTKAEPAQRSKCLGGYVREGGGRAIAVPSAVGMLEFGRLRIWPDHLQGAFVNRAVVGAAQGDEIACIVQAAIGACSHVMEV